MLVNYLAKASEKKVNFLHHLIVKLHVNANNAIEIQAVYT